MRAIILSRRDWREYDQLLTVYSAEDGKGELIARSIKKTTAKNTSLVEPGSCVELEYVHGKELRYLTSVTPWYFFKNIHEHLAAGLYARFALSFIERMVEPGAADPELFALLLNYLMLLDKKPNSAQHLTEWLITQLLRVQGLSPELNICTLCGTKLQAQLFFSFKHGGGVCVVCAQNERDDKTMFRLRLSALEPFRRLFTAPSAREVLSLPEPALSAAHSKLLHRYLVYQTGKHLPFWGHLAQITAL